MLDNLVSQLPEKVDEFRQRNCPSQPCTLQIRPSSYAAGFALDRRGLYDLGSAATLKSVRGKLTELQTIAF